MYKYPLDMANLKIPVSLLICFHFTAHHKEKESTEQKQGSETVSRAARDTATRNRSRPPLAPWLLGYIVGPTKRKGWERQLLVLWKVWAGVDFSARAASIHYSSATARYSYSARILASPGFASHGATWSQSDCRHEWHLYCI